MQEQSKSVKDPTPQMTYPPPHGLPSQFVGRNHSQWTSPYNLKDHVAPHCLVVYSIIYVSAMMHVLFCRGLGVSTNEDVNNIMPKTSSIHLHTS